MSYICTKKLTLRGKEYRPGDVIPEDAIDSGRTSKLAAFGYITTVGDEGAAGGRVPGEAGQLGGGEDVSIAVTFPGEAEGESVAYPIGTEQLQAIADTMRKNADDAAKVIEDEVDESVLVFLANCDSRKKVKEAAQKQLATIISLKDEPNAPSGDTGATDGSGADDPDAGGKTE